MRTVLLWLFVVVGLALPAAAALAQPAPAQPQCTSAYGKTVCGYECKAEYGDHASTQTPWGTCRAAYGKVVCSDGSPELAYRRGPKPKIECKAEYGDIACGYHCKAEYGQIRCAQTPEGRCEAAYGNVTCWDPQPQLGGRRHHHGSGRFDDGFGAPPVQAQTTCKSAYGTTACGYHCEAAYGEVKCAQTPEGVCESAYGKLVCWDPPRGFHGGNPTCKAEYGEIACGYDCRSGYGEVRCAQTPRGQCTVGNGTVTCWDPVH